MMINREKNIDINHTDFVLETNYEIGISARSHHEHHVRPISGSGMHLRRISAFKIKPIFDRWA